MNRTEKRITDLSEERNTEREARRVRLLNKGKQL